MSFGSNLSCPGPSHTFTHTTHTRTHTSPLPHPMAPTCHGQSPCTHTLAHTHTLHPLTTHINPTCLGLTPPTCSPPRGHNPTCGPHQGRPVGLSTLLCGHARASRPGPPSRDGPIASRVTCTWDASCVASPQDNPRTLRRLDASCWVSQQVLRMDVGPAMVMQHPFHELQDGATQCNTAPMMTCTEIHRMHVKRDSSLGATQCVTHTL